MNDEKLAPELQKKIDEVAVQAAKEHKKRFDPQKGLLHGLLCFGLFFAFGIVMRAGLFNALGFGVIGGGVGFICGACQRPSKQ